MYYDNTVFGKGDNGFVILKHQNRFYLFLSPYMEEKKGVCFTDDGTNNILIGAQFIEKKGIELTVQTQEGNDEAYLMLFTNEVAEALVKFLSNKVLHN